MQDPSPPVTPREEKQLPGPLRRTCCNKSDTYETVQKHEQRGITLCTVPVILRHGDRRLQVNCFLDEGSDTCYVKMWWRRS